MSEKADVEILEDLFLSIPPKSLIKSISLVNCKIKDISLLLSILRLDNLKILNLSWNYLTNLRFLEGLRIRNLSILNLDFNKINDLTPLIPIIEQSIGPASHLYKLRLISLSNNNINYEDMKFFEFKKILKRAGIFLGLDFDKQLLKQKKKRISFVLLLRSNEK